MRILKIKLNNINSLRCGWELDFTKEPLNSSGLFAITGPTGSGKSTILDAITLALFNRIPRYDSNLSKNNIDKTGFILTRNENECFVEVDYTCKKGRFRSKWSIDKTRKGTLKDYEMELSDLNTGKFFDLKKKAIPEKNEELIGLKYDQFIKSILLSQGEFAKFLKASKSERGKLLEDVTGMHIYSEIGRRAFEVFKEKNEVIKTKNSLLEEQKSILLDDESLSGLNKALYDISGKIKTADLKLNSDRQLLETKKRIGSINEQIGGYEKELNQIKINLADFNTGKKEKLEKHEKLLGLLEDIRNYFIEKQNYDDLQIDLQSENLRLKNENDKQIEIVKRVSSFIKKETTQEIVIEDINTFRESAATLQTVLNKEKNSLSHQQKRITEIISKADFKSLQLKYHNNQELLQIIKAEINQSEEHLKSLFKNHQLSNESLLIRKEEAEGRAIKLVELKGLVERYTAYSNQQKEVLKNCREAESDLKNKVPNIRILETEANQAQLQIEQMEQEELRRTLESGSDVKQLRNQLKDEDPCPVCGATHHPYSIKFEDKLEEIKSLHQIAKATKKETDKSLKDLQLEIQKLETLSNNYKKQLVEFDEQLNNIKVSVNECRSFLKLEKVGSSAALNEMIRNNTQEKNAINDAEKELQKISILSELSGVLTNRMLQVEKVTKAKDDLFKVYEGTELNNDCNEFLKIVHTVKNAINECAANIKRITEAIERKKKLITHHIQELNPELKKLNYNNIDEARRNILEDALFNQYKNERAAILANQQEFTSLKNVALKSKSDLCENDDPNITIEDSMLQIEQITTVLSSLREIEKDKTAEKKADDQRRKSVEKLSVEIGAVKVANLKWELLAKYIGDGQGKSFSTFAQGLTLKKLIGLSNIHLKKLSDRYLLDSPKEEEDDDLTIIDTYLGYERRSIKTLSGGETFIASLSLALALSDLASRNVKIESLFIDEGFGSLDPETLDQAISTLEQLQTESNKTIGIISHVDSLKERIQTQIQLEKNSNGFSKLKVVHL